MSLGVVIGVTVVAVVVWGIIGGVYRRPNSKGQNHPTGSGGGSNCSHCKEVQSYFNGLHWIIKALKLVWYGYKKIECAIQGCPI